MEEVLSSVIMNQNRSDNMLPNPHSELSSETTRLFSSKPHHSSLVKYTRLNESEEDVNYNKDKCISIDGNAIGEEVIEDGEVDELDKQFSYNRQVSVSDFSPHRGSSSIKRNNYVDNTSLATDPTSFSTNSAKFSWRDNDTGHQFKSITNNTSNKQEKSNSETTIASSSLTFPSNSPPDIFSSTGRSATTIKNNPSWLATQPKLNAKSKSGYILFSAEVRKRVMNENPEAGFGEVSKIVGIEWKRLSDEDKRDYETRAQYIAAERAKAELLTPNSKLPQPGQIRIYCCRWQQCDFQFDSHDGLYAHIRTSHTSKLDNDSQYACLWNSCLKYRKEGKPFPSLPRLNRHLKEKHLASAMRLVFPNQRAKNFFIYTPLKQEFPSFPSTSNGGSHHNVKSGHVNSGINENYGHFVHYPYGDVPANPVACEVATPLYFCGTKSDSSSVVKRRAQGGQQQSSTSIHNMTSTTFSSGTPKLGGASTLLNGALPSYSANTNFNNPGISAGSYNFSIQQNHSQNLRHLTNQQNNITQQTVYIPHGQQAIIVNGVTVYIPSNAQTIILPPGYTGPQQLHQIVVHTQPTQQQVAQQTSSTLTHFSSINASSSPLIQHQQKTQNTTSTHSLTSHSSQQPFSSTPTFHQQYNQGVSLAMSPPIQSQSYGSPMQNVTTNIVHDYQNQQQGVAHYDQSSTFNQHYLTGAPSTTIAVASEIQNTDPGRIIVSATPKQQMSSEPIFFSPSTSVHVRRVVHSEAYIRYLESMHNSGGKQQRNVSKWDKALLASARNTVIPEHKRLPYDWIRYSSNGSKNKEDEIVHALWKLREYLVEDTTGITRSQGISHEAEPPLTPGYNLLSTKIREVENLNTDKKKCG